MATDYRDLIAWRKAMELVTLVYRCSAAWPGSERFGLISQARRAAVSVPANIAEGEGRMNGGDFGRFLRIAHGSLRELETHIMIARNLGFITLAEQQALLHTCGEVGRLINGLLRSIKDKSA